jgi:uncharacterized YccA/Bax inhibitor family protein
MMRSGNPTLKDGIFTSAGSVDKSEAMTVQGTVNKTFILLVIAFLTASFVWTRPVAAAPFLMPSLIVGFIVGLATIFKKEWAPFTSPVYAALEGVIIGTISSVFERQYPGIVIQAVSLTFGTLFCLLLAYKSRLIKATENFKLGVFAATGAIAVVYLISIVMGFFGRTIPFIHDSGPVGIIFSLFVVVIAALNLVMDFDFIERGAEYGAPRYMEWYGAFALIVTLIWLYLEILRLLAKSRRR